MKVKMIKNQKGSPNGTIVFDYVADKEYDIPEKLANVFLKIGVSEKVKENKEVGFAPENKDLGSAPINKEELKLIGKRK